VVTLLFHPPDDASATASDDHDKTMIKLTPPPLDAERCTMTAVLLHHLQQGGVGGHTPLLPTRRRIRHGKTMIKVIKR
jgi:hypothetical protein